MDKHAKFHQVEVSAAGDVEVLHSGVQRYQAADVLGAGRPGFWVHAGDYNANVTRLTAERDGLLAEVEEWKRRCQYNADTAHDLQSELTKARELIEELQSPDGRRVEAVLDQLYAIFATPIAHNADESCGQDAEAAKGGAV